MRLPFEFYFRRSGALVDALGVYLPLYILKSFGMTSKQVTLNNLIIDDCSK